MAGSLIKIDEEIVSSAVASVTLGGSDWDSSYDVYMVKYNNYTSDTNVAIRLRFTVSGTADTSSNYDIAFKSLQADSAFSNLSATNGNKLTINDVGTDTGEISNGVLYLFNFNNASEYSFVTMETTGRQASGHLRGRQGGGVLTVAQATDGVQFFQDVGNITAGKYTLYGLKK